MSLMANSSIKTKILSIVVLLCLAGLGASATLAYFYKQTDNRYSDYLTTNSPATMIAARVTTAMMSAGYFSYELVVYDNDNPAYAGILDRYAGSKKDVLDRLDKVAGLTPEHTEAVNDFKDRASKIFASMDQAIQLDAGAKHDEATKLLATTDDALDKWRADLRNYNDARQKDLDVQSDVLTSATNSTILTCLVAIAVVFLAGIALALAVAVRGISAPIVGLASRMASLAGGDTASKVEGVERKDEIGDMAKAMLVFQESAIERIRLERETEANRSLSEKERIEREQQKAKEAADIDFAVKSLAAGLSKLSEGDVSYRIDQSFVATLDSVRHDFNESAGKLQSALTTVALNARGIDAGSNEIMSAANDLAKRTEQQAAAVEETAAALEEITTVVRDSTKRAQEAGQLVGRAKAGAERSGQVVQQAVIAMEQISHSANEISSIIGVIDEIAFQTNLLALNAGVEAARAGDAGKGFAVVAQEVRELAQRSANAAKEIKALITTSNSQVVAGVKLVGETGRALETIVGEVQDINRHVMWPSSRRPRNSPPACSRSIRRSTRWTRIPRRTQPWSRNRPRQATAWRERPHRSISCCRSSGLATLRMVATPAGPAMNQPRGRPRARIVRLPRRCAISAARSSLPSRATRRSTPRKTGKNSEQTVRSSFS
jgi:methyl-accepting chemotaxis protein